MDIGIIRERGAFDRRVALTPPVVRRLAGAGHKVWAETGAGDGAMFSDTEYIRARAHIAWSPEEVIQRSGQMTVPVAAHLLRSSSGGRGILLGGTRECRRRGW